MLKWLFRWDGLKKTKCRDPILSDLYAGDRGLENLHDNNEIIRLWLPEPLRIGIYETCIELKCTESLYLREFIVIYLYGIHELLRMRNNKTGIYLKTQYSEYSRYGARYARTTLNEVIPGLGKNIIPLKLRLPSKVKSDLKHLSEQRGISIGRFAREILVQHFLGHTIFSDKLVCLSPLEENIAKEWENGIEYDGYSADEGNLEDLDRSPWGV